MPRKKESSPTDIQTDHAPSGKAAKGQAAPKTSSAAQAQDVRLTAAHDAAREQMHEPTAEEVEALIQGRDRTHFEGLGDAWAVLVGQDPAAVMAQVVGTVLHEGGTRPAWQWLRGGQEHVLMAWPKEQPLRASVLMSGEQGQQLRPVTAVPLLEGVPNDLTVEEVHPWQSGVEAHVAVSMLEGKNPMWFYDPLYGRDKDDLTPGITHTFLLAGLAYGLRKALLDEVTINQGPRFELWAAQWLDQNPGKSRLDVPPLKVSVAGKQMIMPGRRFCEYQIRSVVEEVQDVQLEKMPVKLIYLSFPFDEREALRLPIYASKMVLGDYEPEKGQEVEAYIWLQGRIIDMDESPQQ